MRAPRPTSTSLAPDSNERFIFSDREVCEVRLDLRAIEIPAASGRSDFRDGIGSWSFRPCAGAG